MEQVNVNNQMKLIYSFHEAMVKNGFTLVYEGEITHQITKAFTSMAENSMIKSSEDVNVKRKVFHVMVECLQNLSKHADDSFFEENQQHGSGVFIVGKEDKAYYIITGNVITKERAEYLKATLDNINNLDKEGLKNLYKKIIKEGSLSDKGGAGLGLIDIARKTGEKLEYYFHPIDEYTIFFLLKIKVSRIKGSDENE